MKYFLPIILSLAISLPMLGQQYSIDSLKNSLVFEKTDTGKSILLYRLSSAYQAFMPDSALLYAKEAYQLAVKTNFTRGQRWALNQMAQAYYILGDNPRGFELYIKQLKMEEQDGFAENIAIIYMDIALVYHNDKDFSNALIYALKADSIIRKNNISSLELYNLLNLGDIYEKENDLPKALLFTQNCFLLAEREANSLVGAIASNNLGNIYLKMGKWMSAKESYNSSLVYLMGIKESSTSSEGMLGMAKAYEKMGMLDSVSFFATQ